MEKGLSNVETEGWRNENKVANYFFIKQISRKSIFEHL